MVDHVERVHVVGARLQVDPVGVEGVPLIRVDRPRARGPGALVEPFIGGGGGKHGRRRLAVGVDEMDPTAFSISRSNHPVVAGDDRQVFGTDQSADEFDVADRIALGGDASLGHAQSQPEDRRQHQTVQHSHIASTTAARRTLPPSCGPGLLRQFRRNLAEATCWQEALMRPSSVVAAGDPLVPLSTVPIA